MIFLSFLILTMALILFWMDYRLTACALIFIAACYIAYWLWIASDPAF